MEEVLAAGEGATVINVASLGYQLAEANLDDPNFDVSSSKYICFNYSSKDQWGSNCFTRMANHTTDGVLMGNRRPQTYFTRQHWVRSSAAKVSPCSPSIPVVSLELHSPRRKPDKYPVIMESKLLANTGITNEYFMEAYQMAVERNNGTLRTRVYHCPSSISLNPLRTGNPLPPQTTKTLGQGAATIVIAALDPSFRSKRWIP